MLALSPLLAALLPAPAHALTCDEVRGLADSDVPTPIIVSVIEEASVVPTDLAACLAHHGLAPEVVHAATARRPHPPAADPLPTPTAPAAVDHWEAELARISDLRDRHRPLAASAVATDLLEAEPPRAVAREAQYLLATVWIDLELPTSARNQLLQIVHGGTTDPVGRAALRALLAPVGDGPAAHLLVLAPLLPEGVTADGLPPGPADAAAYLHGLALLDAGDLTAARSTLGQVDGPLAGRADAVRAAIAHEQGFARTSGMALRRSFRWAATHHDLDLHDHTAMAAGRLTYGLGMTGPSAEAYGKVLPGRPLWPDAREEQAWAWFLDGQTDRALGNAVALASPWGQTTPTPEIDLIEGIARLETCRFDSAERTASELARQLRTTVAHLDAWLQHTSPDTAWSDAFGGGATGAHGAQVPVGVWRVALRDRRLAAYAAQLDALEAERARIDHQKPAWVDAVGAELARALQEEHDRVTRLAGTRLVASLQRQRAHFADVLQQADVLAFEAVDGQRRMLQALAHDPGPGTLAPGDTIDFAVATDRVYWPFNGEYWADELDAYRVDLPSLCGELAAGPGPRLAVHRM